MGWGRDFRWLSGLKIELLDEHMKNASSIEIQG
jgi:hypothetical protein